MEETQEDRAMQTEQTVKINKWTQRPPAWSSGKAQNSDIRILREVYTFCNKKA